MPVQNVGAKNNLSSQPCAYGAGHKSMVPVFAVCVLVWAVDFKATVSGGAAALQGAILLIYAAGSFYLIVSALRQGVGAGPLWVLLLALFIFVAESSVVGLSKGQEAYAIFVNMLPSLVFAVALVITYMTLETSRENLSPVLNVLRSACLLFVVVRVIVVILTRGKINLADTRYEVLSGATVPALALIAVGFVKRLSILDIAALLLNLLVTLISVTRTFLLVLILQIASVFIARPSAVLKASTWRAVAVFGAAMVMIVALDLGTGTALTSRWVQRITVSQKFGTDPTSLTRKAEVKFMLHELAATTDSMLFGNGLAALTSLTGPDARLVARLVGKGSVSFHSIGFGHENYVSILFIGGLLGGGWLIYFLFLNGYQSLILIKRFDAARLQLQDAHAQIGLWGALIVIGTLAQGFFSGVLADRDSALWYGIATAMLYWARNRTFPTDS